MTSGGGWLTAVLMTGKNSHTATASATAALIFCTSLLSRICLWAVESADWEMNWPGLALRLMNVLGFSTRLSKNFSRCFEGFFGMVPFVSVGLLSMACDCHLPAHAINRCRGAVGRLIFYSKNVVLR